MYSTSCNWENDAIRNHNFVINEQICYAGFYCSKFRPPTVSKSTKFEAFPFQGTVMKSRSPRESPIDQKPKAPLL
ncbi:hypothetical protein T02_11985 [Trichinella nativa]|uniref:Uncharacterized protein n=1 Tax=Trichinella nativa TaxID=6335 RepID=A0A0V1LT28_9BILA|nr:hypothetical protein T02_11985 [Trichinella nativa]